MSHNPMPGGMRLDQYLAESGQARSRSAARDAILRGRVRVDGIAIRKPGAKVQRHWTIEIEDPAGAYVSRSALKLIAGLDHFGFQPSGLTVLDLGASTGGFTQVLLERGADAVLAVDVGHNQISPSLRKDGRVVNLEGLNCRDLSTNRLGGRQFQAIVCDVSFISLRLALPASLALAPLGCWAVFLVKPQFEVGPGKIGKDGRVRTPAAAETAAADIEKWLGRQPGWRSQGLIPSPILGGQGNREYLLGTTKPDET